MKFQWYLINLDEASVEGTNDVEQVQQYLQDEDYLVLTAQHGKYYCGSTQENEVHELDTSQDDDSSDDEDAEED